MYYWLQNLLLLSCVNLVYMSWPNCTPQQNHNTLGKTNIDVRHHLQVSFHSQAMEEAVLARLHRAKQCLFLEGGTIDNDRPFTSLLDALDGRVTGDVAQREEPLATPELLLNSSGYFV